MASMLKDKAKRGLPFAKAAKGRPPWMFLEQKDVPPAQRMPATVAVARVASSAANCSAVTVKIV